MSFKLSIKDQTRLNVKRVFCAIKKELSLSKDAFKVIIKYCEEITRNLQKDENMQFACVQANTMLKEAANGDKFYFEDFGFAPKNMLGIDRINRTCFIIAQYMFSENPIFDNCEIIIRMSNRIVQYEFKARLLSYVYTLACHFIKHPAQNTTFDWHWEKTNDLIYVYSYNLVQNKNTPEKRDEILRSTKMILFKIDNEVLDEIASLKVCDVPRDMLMGNFDYEKYFKFAKIYYETICPENKVRAVRTFYIILLHLKLDLPTFKGYLPPKIIEHIMSFVSINIGVVLSK